MSTPIPTVAIGDSFLKSMMALPDKIMKKARETITKFQHDPTSPGLNYEKINNAKDHRLRSIRIDQTYRCIVLKSEKGDTYILLWVDKHDEAYAWAEGRTCAVNPQTGSIQVVEVHEESVPAVETTTKAPKKTDDRPGIFDPFTNKDLEQLGASREMLPVIRSIKDDAALEERQRHFPGQVYEALFMLACGENYDDVLDELGINKDEAYDPEDFQEALKLDTNKQHFAAITDDADLEAILNEPLALWRVYLHPSQRKLVQTTFNGPVRVLGGAGTGKTVVAMHRAQRLASQIEGNERILFTTFTKSLIEDIKNNLQKICSYDEIKKIEVIHLDAWCHNFLKSKNFKHDIAYGSPGPNGHPAQTRLWEQALEELDSDSFSTSFLREEWDKVIQYHDIEGFSDYARIPRTGRRGRLSRLQRKVIWPVFDEYRTLLNENQLWEPPDMMRAARSILGSGQLSAGFKHIIVDEIQDFHPQAFRLLRAMLPPDQFSRNDLFLVGDGHQNVYGHHIVLGQLGIAIRGRGRRLRLNYRTPEQTRRWASSILKGIDINDLDGSSDTERGYRSIISGPEPRFESCESFDAEIATISKWIKEIRDANNDHVVCVAVRSNKERTAYGKALKEGGFKIHEITDKEHDIADPVPVRIATMHRIKGLEFDHVCLAGRRTKDWESYSAERLEMEKCLLHVAATRTKNSLLVTQVDRVLTSSP
jgi:hypothetical protein